ncbi:MAG: hypothetical protein A3D92_03475 [Bacteroidetes bacterium RIFCSPHIGHO2_02_FULL_44_7]|nr:MAG: hypothetical protein A3D92_03475 [Bacteroidetes bacterium RIFCSPHIGHO2_02_FULL_44_7]
MKKLLLPVLLTFALGTKVSAQNSTITGSEIGIDLAFSGSNFGGNVGLGVKYGLNLGEYVIAGPSVRYEQIWWKNYTGGSAAASGSRSVYGGGVFIHGRFFNALFVGAEFEMLRSPYDKNGLFAVSKTWAPTLFLGGGFSMEFNEKVRVNAGIMYDVINVQNSPFRRSYSVQKKSANGAVAGYLPIIYRIAFFFPIS